MTDGFEGYKILQVSDLHNKRFGKGQRRLVELTKEIGPDVIVITGDVIDSRRTNVNKALEYADKAVEIAPVYFVPGNHESRVDEYLQLKEGLVKSGVKILDNKSEDIFINDERISLIGMNDLTLFDSENIKQSYERVLNNLVNESGDGLKVLLSHRPELLNVYTRQGLDLVFTGHAHGGQIRLPFINGLFAPGQGILPKYTSGVYKQGKTNMIVSRGLGNSLFPFRVFNRPELIIARLSSN
ncbi:MAG: metallophosphoesterase [Peptostreptococcaceae bacterium]